MDQVKLFAFSLNRDALTEYIGNVREFCDKKGIDYKGPIPLAVTEFEGPLNCIESGDLLGSAPSWVQSIQFDEQTISRLATYDTPVEDEKYALMSRILVAYSSTAAQELLEIPIPDSVCLHVTTDAIKASSTGDHGPYTYDSGRDHVTDTDYDAHHT